MTADRPGGPYNGLVPSDDLRRFARRDWATAATGKGDYWAQQYLSLLGARRQRAVLSQSGGRDDGGRFLINTVLDDAAPPITLIQNWNPEAKR